MMECVKGLLKRHEAQSTFKKNDKIRIKDETSSVLRETIAACAAQNENDSAYVVEDHVKK